jgi:ferredoxin
LSRHLIVNPITCEAHGICAELLPELIRLDDWGYPIIDPSPIPPELEAHAKRAVAACPTLALLIRQTETDMENEGAAGRRRRRRS